MGFIHETGSDIVGVETRSESMYIRDVSEKTDHFFTAQLHKRSLQQTISADLMRQAGEKYTQGDEDGAAEFKKFASIISRMDLGADEEIYSVEVTYEWMADFLDFINGNEKILKDLNTYRGRRKQTEVAKA